MSVDSPQEWGDGNAATPLSGARLTEIETRITQVEGDAITKMTNEHTAAYTLTVTDAGKCIDANSATAIPITVPPHSTAALPVGAIIDLCQTGTGVLIVQAGAGVTIRSAAGTFTAKGRYSTLKLRQRATNEWVLTGELSATELAPSVVFTPGVNAGIFETKDKEAVEQMKAKVVRAEISASNLTKANVEAICSGFLARGVAGIILLVEFDGPELVNKAFTAEQAKSLGAYAGIPGLRYVELGNETSYGYQYSDGYAEASYKLRAREYATRVQEAGQAVAGTGLGILCQADDGNSGSSVWVDEMYAQVPELHKFIAGWVIHAYATGTYPTLKSGPRVERLVKQVGAHGGGAIPIDITEWGIETDEGRTLSNGRNPTFAEAVAQAETQIAEMKAAAGPNRLRSLMIYQDRDQRKPGETGENHEWYFGVLTHELANKGVWTTFLEALLAEGH